MNPLSRPAEALLQSALHQLDSGERQGAFAMLSYGTERKLVRFVDAANSREGEELGRRAVREAAEKAIAYAIVWDGYLRLESGRVDAFFVEVAGRTDEASRVLARPYAERDGGGIDFLGDVVQVALQRNALFGDDVFMLPWNESVLFDGEHDDARGRVASHVVQCNVADAANLARVARVARARAHYARRFWMRGGLDGQTVVIKELAGSDAPPTDENAARTRAYLRQHAGADGCTVAFWAELQSQRSN